MDILSLRTVGALKKAGYRTRSIKEELRNNLIRKLSQGKSVFEGIWGYENTALPQLETAILAQHNILLLGLRGQAKTRIARLMIEFLDEYVPVLAECELFEDPFNPITAQGQELISRLGDEAPIVWIHRNERYTEKLATPDVSVADLIGDIDPIKAATLKLPYSDPRVIHYGLVPRAHRCIFVINELPDLQPRIQVALFNILQEQDIQIRGYKLRLPLDIQFVFTANPEDYTQRGSIVTPLKDRIGSQILTHYPKTLHVAKKITQQEARILPEVRSRIEVHELLKDIIERIVIAARKSEYVDPKSGVSARLSISAYEMLVAHTELRLLQNHEPRGYARLSDIYGIIPAIVGKIELVYEGEKEGAETVAHHLIGLGLKEEFLQYFPSPERYKRGNRPNPYQTVLDWFNSGNLLELPRFAAAHTYQKALVSVPGLENLVSQIAKPSSENHKFLLMELALHGLAEFSLIGRSVGEEGMQFRDILGELLQKKDDDEED
ncbi:MAG: magnesium chelatase [Bacteroidia bacterium]